MSTGASEVVLEAAVVAAVAAHAARRTPGVLRLETGLGGLVHRVGVRARHQVNRVDDGGPADTTGVAVDLVGADPADPADPVAPVDLGHVHAEVRVDLALHGDVAVPACAHEVQRRVVDALRADVGLGSVRVRVCVLEVAVGRPAGETGSPR